MVDSLNAIAIHSFRFAVRLHHDAARCGGRFEALPYPDFEKVWDRKLILAAMGQGFFSLTIGGCSMLIYGSYLSKKENLPKMAMNVTLVDTSVAFIAGLVVMPAMFVAMQKGVQIYAEDGALLSSDTLVFTVLPLMFESLGLLGLVFSVVFFFF